MKHGKRLWTLVSPAGVTAAALAFAAPVIMLYGATT
jgi:hypothetical protein